jgi:hypothetical protein
LGSPTRLVTQAMGNRAGDSAVLAHDCVTLARVFRPVVRDPASFDERGVWRLRWIRTHRRLRACKVAQNSTGRPTEPPRSPRVPEQ